MTAPKWFSGPPPAVGWWPASIAGTFTDFYRWWDGVFWSSPVFNCESKRTAGILACRKSSNTRLIKWRHWSISIDGTDGKGAHE